MKSAGHGGRARHLALSQNFRSNKQTEDAVVTEEPNQSRRSIATVGQFRYAWPNFNATWTQNGPGQRTPSRGMMPMVRPSEIRMRNQITIKPKLTAAKRPQTSNKSG